MMDYLTIPLTFAIFIVTLGLTIVVRNILLKRSLLDHPNERSSHKVAVPRGGGWAVMAVLVPGMIILAMLQHNLVEHTGLIIGAILLVIISWLDDRKGGVNAGLRLSMHIAAACIGSLAFPASETLFGGYLPFWLDRTLMIVGWAWFINLYNFMDGIDGITGVESISIAIGVSLIFTLANINDPYADTLATLVIGACLGFLVLNWHPAKIFLGDVGSIPLGYLCGFLLLSLAVKGQLVPALIIPAYYLADSGITLVRRAMRGEKVWKAHREHFYQIAAQRLKRHDRVVYMIIATNVGLVAAAAVAVYQPLIGLTLAAIIVAILLRKCVN